MSATSSACARGMCTVYEVYIDYMRADGTTRRRILGCRGHTSQNQYWRKTVDAREGFDGRSLCLSLENLEPRCRRSTSLQQRCVWSQQRGFSCWKGNGFSTWLYWFDNIQIVAHCSALTSAGKAGNFARNQLQDLLRGMKLDDKLYGFFWSEPKFWLFFSTITFLRDFEHLFFI